MIRGMRLQTKSASAPPAPAIGDRRRTARTETKRIVVPFEIKAEAVDEEERTFEGLASVWGLDLGDDVMHKGAFKAWIKDWKARNEALPLLNSHNAYDIMSALGQLLDVRETDVGLWTKWEIIEGEDGDRVLARIRPSARTGRSAVGKMSIGYVPKKFDFEESETARWGQIRNLREVALEEVSLVIFPMAPGAAIDSGSVKQMLAAAAAADPEDLDPETKADLRKLATRIGLLIKGSKTGGSSSEPPAEAPPAAPAASSSSTEPPAEPPAPSAAAPAAAPAVTEEGEPGEKGAEPAYLYGEALQQRLLRLRLHTTSHQTGNVQ